MNLKVNGVYNLDTIRHLQILKIVDFVFDFRPRSLNFIQIKNVSEMLNQLSMQNTNVSFHFGEEKDFVVFQTLKTLSENLTSKWDYTLYLSGVAGFEVYEKYEEPYIWIYTELVELPKIKLEYIKGIQFDYNFLEQQMQFGTLFSLITKLKDTFGEEIKLEFQAGWNQPLMETITDFINFSSINYEINSEVELSFRNIDLAALNKYIEPKQLMKD